MTAHPKSFSHVFVAALAILIVAAAAVPALAGMKIARKGQAEARVVVRSAGQDLILAGGSPRGTLYAVYTFLEEVVGCRFWTGTASRMPWRPSLEVGTIAIRFKPPLEYREPFWYVAFDPVWAARNKANGTRAGGDALRGGRQIYEGFVHTFYSLIPPEKYFAEHPEWFSEIEGKRTFKNAQLCLTNLEAAKKKARRSAEYSRRVRRASLPVAYVVLTRWDALREEARKEGKRWPWPETRDGLLEWFLKAAREENITMISEWQTLADWAAKGGKTK